MSDEQTPPQKRKPGRPPKAEAAKAKPAKAKRPKDFNATIAALICGRVADGATLTELCKDATMPSRDTVRRWEGEHPEFRVNLQIAVQHRADSRADAIHAVTEDVKRGKIDPHSARVMSDNLRWLAAKERPSTYSDKQTVAHTGDGRSLGEELAGAEAMLLSMERAAIRPL